MRLNILDIDQLPLKALVSNYLMSSYAYTHLNATYMSDEAFDYLCRKLDKYFDEIECQHKHLIDRAALSSTTGYYLKEEDYPSIVKIVAMELTRS